MTRDEALLLLASRVASIPDALAGVPDALAAARDAVDALAGFRTGAGARPLVASGVGLSEGPARVLVALARERGHDARFVPVSAFARAEPPGGRDAQLVLFSQGLSPNARLALAHAATYTAPPVLVTSVEATPYRVHVLCVPPASEDRLLLRVVGPAVATYAAVLLAAPELAGAHVSAVLDAYRVADATACDALAGAPERPIAFVIADGGDPELVFALRWKVLEALRVHDPPAWDVLQLAHGPVQAFWERELTLIALEREGDAAGVMLVDRLAGALAERHVLVRLRARLPGALALFEWDAALDRALLAALARTHLTLDTWPGAPVDGALYAVDRSPMRATETP